jgi:hypothetical protein
MVTYVYNKQYHALMSFLGEAGLAAQSGPGRIVSVAESSHLRGLLGGVLAIVEGHRFPVPEDFIDVAVINGMLIMRLSDQFFRDKKYTQQLARGEIVADDAAQSQRA